MKPVNLMWLFLLLFFCPPCLAADPISIKLSLDRTEAGMDDTIQMDVHVSGARSSDAPPVILGLDAFHVTRGGSSSSVHIINGTFSSGVNFSFFLTPTKPGTFQIGPAEVRIDGKAYKSDVQTIHVRQQNAGGNAPSKGIFLVSSLSKDKVFAEEQPIYTLRLYLRRQATNISLQLPEQENLTFTQLAKPSEYEGAYDGLQYRIIEIPYALTPLKEGKYRIDPARMNMTVNEPGRRSARGLFDDPFFSGGLMSGNRPLSIASNVLELIVEPLPLKGRPESFSGLVGDFTISAGIDPLRLKAGESATLTVKVEGRGNINRIPDMKMPELQDVKVYADEPVLTSEMDPAGIRGSKTMKWALVPEKEGTYTIPSLTVPFFDPKKAQYQRLETTPFPLTVLAGKESRSEKIPVGESDTSRLPPVKQDVKEIGHDILPLHDSVRNLGLVENNWNGSDGQKGTFLQWMLLIAPGVFYGFALGVLKIKKRSIHSAHVQRAKKAAGKAIRSCLLEGSDAGCLILAVRDYVNDRFGLEMAAITADDLISLLRARGVPPDMAMKLGSLLKQLENAIYTGQDRTREPIGTEIAACIKQMEREIK